MTEEVGSGNFPTACEGSIKSQFLLSCVCFSDLYIISTVCSCLILLLAVGLSLVLFKCRWKKTEGTSTNAVVLWTETKCDAEMFQLLNVHCHVLIIWSIHRFRLIGSEEHKRRRWGNVSFFIQSFSVPKISAMHYCQNYVKPLCPSAKVILKFSNYISCYKI